MKECNCRRIPPCYGSLERAIYEEAKKINEEWKRSRARHGKLIDKLRNKLMEGGFLDDTHDKVYGVNKQMCDIGKTMNDPFEPISKEAIQEVAKALEITRNPKSIMEEKKTKKMTKAEAFEYLKHKKVACYNRKEVDIQKKLFKIGFKWCDGTTVEEVGMFDFFLIDDGTFQFTDNVYHFRKHAYEEIGMDDILSIEIVDENKTEEEKALDKISCLGAQIVDILLHMKGHHHVTITETDVTLHDEGMSLFHSDPF